MIVGGVFTFTRSVSVRYTVTVSTRRATSPPSFVIGMRRVDVGRVRVLSCDSTTEAPSVTIATAPARDFAEIRIMTCPSPFPSSTCPRGRQPGGEIRPPNDHTTSRHLQRAQAYSVPERVA